MKATVCLSLSGGDNELGFVAIVFGFLFAEREDYDHCKPQTQQRLLLIYRLRTPTTYPQFAFLLNLDLFEGALNGLATYLLKGKNA